MRCVLGPSCGTEPRTTAECSVFLSSSSHPMGIVLLKTAAAGCTADATTRTHMNAIRGDTLLLPFICTTMNIVDSGALVATLIRVRERMNLLY